MLLTWRSTVRSLIVRAVGDRPVGQAGGDKPENLDLARAQATRRRVGRIDNLPSGVEPGQIRRRPQSCEHVAGGVGFAYLPIGVAEHSAGGGGQDPDSGGIVRRIERRPRLPCPAQDVERALDIVLRETHGAIGVQGHRSEERSVRPRGHRGESIGRFASGDDIPGGQSDLGRGLEQPRSNEVVDRLGLGAPDGRRGRTDVALREPQQRMTGFGESPPRTGLAVADLGRFERPAQSVELGELIDRLADLWLGRRSRQPFARAFSLGTRVLPCTVEAHELCAVDKAVAPKRDEVRLRIEPARQRRCPLLRSSQVVQLVAGLDDRAVDDA